MKDSNFLKENNARHMWHPMAHPADSMANPPAIITGGAAAAVAAVEEIIRIKPWENAAAMGAKLKAGLHALADHHEIIGDVRGEGLMCAIEFVTDRKTKAPAASAAGLAFQKAAYDDGVMIRVSGNNAIFSPPLVIDASHVEKILLATETGLKAMVSA
ncbi:aminotransferase class III-fold pyridoxal phosphate-dependent enzyme [Pseudosulfitobacter sp. DSM 107133]|uniref:aminotransferase class III-fold pyridoxal phosphate-dependent enzyme n=1 Tax=Pseudosulfitobacter sp. DSM 107133 TaxID=2883100 RepID=UPI000DF46F17|nr:aminotransferase class III-fold pyridoxal phosphate-dependent enzyme [Pseudosulfitobacter sp. DSM 107133]UOA25887.1 Taurine--pyruvate aminotransferase [Pseudosulfitobacter sp. DSM 107133]